jgi:ABC-2 type transport system permease protein
MRAFLGIVRFELRQGLRRLSVWVYATVFFWLGVLLTASFGGAMPGFDMGSSRVLVNSPYAVTSFTIMLTLMMVPVTAAVVGQAVHRDFAAGIHPLFFTTPMGRMAYLGGRFTGGVLTNVVVALAGPLGMFAGLALPSIDKQRIGPFRLDAYLQALAFVSIPNLLFTGALFFALAAFTRKMLPNYVGGILLLLGYGLAGQLIRDLDDRTVACLVDPFGTTAIRQATRYWTVWEQNVASLPLDPLVLANRGLWLALGAAVFAVVYLRFPFAHAVGDRGRTVRAPGGVEDEAVPPPEHLAVPPVPLSASRRTRLAQWWAMTRRAFLEVVGSVYFGAMVAACLAFTVLGARNIGSAWGTTTYPVTYLVVETVQAAFSLFLLIIITFYAGELVWHDRELRVAPMTDALPLPGWSLFLSKLAALSAVIVGLQATAMGAGMAIQAAYGYTRFEPGQYALALFVVDLVPWLELTAMALLLHVVADHKYIGHFVLIVYYLVSAYVGIEVEHNLAVFGSAPSVAYSDMNGWGHTLAPWSWFHLYWSGVAVLLALAANLFWVRGQESAPAWRLRIARARATRPVLAAGGAALALVLAAGGFVFYNTNVLNEFSTGEEATQGATDYEKKYKRYEMAPQPKITAAKLTVDLYPERQEMRARGVYRLRNRTGVPIDTLHVDLPSQLEVAVLKPSRPATRIIADQENGYHAWRLTTPLAPGDSMELAWDVALRTPGFTNETPLGPVLGNGTFVHSTMFPSIGYNPSGELDGEEVRERQGLPPRPRTAPIGDSAGGQRNMISRAADWIDFEATVSTSADQTAVAPGYLQWDSVKGGRRVFHYRMDAPMLDFYAFLSGRYQVRRDRWNGVAIEIFHHPGHEYNLDRMVSSVKASLDYFTRHFGPYQHRQVRILEFPRYAAFAQSFANTIPYSEAIGFIAKVDEDDVDYPYFVTAHEVAHQWWGHQVVGADVQGAAMLSETLAEYSALMVMEEAYGRERMEDFLAYELDQYLEGRGGERRAEMPLYLVEGQPYIHYYKGGLAMYALRDAIGEDRVNAALAAFLREWKHRGPPYATSLDLLRHLEAVTPPAQRPLLDDLFRHVTLFDNRVAGARATPLSGGRYRVEATVEVRKLRADSLGGETPVPVRDEVEVAVYGENDSLLYLRPHRFDGPLRRVTVTVDGRPVRVEVDPRRKLVDRRASDNERDVEVAGAAPPRRR